MAALRFFVNDKRISTAVPLKDGSLLQVYPVKKKYLNENAWRVSWESSNLAKPSLRVEEDGDELRNVHKNWICPPCGKGPGNDHRMCICSAFNYSVERWEKACGIYKKSSSSSAPPPTPSSSPEIPNQTSSSSSSSSSKKIDVKDWDFKHATTHTFPPGRYYIGDLCYVLGDEMYDTIYGGYNYDDGLYTKKNTTISFFVGSTAYGDGYYYGSDGNDFAVDAGIIGICTQPCILKNDGGGHAYTFTEQVKCTFKRGIFKFVSGDTTLVIDTESSDTDE